MTDIKIPVRPVDDIVAENDEHARVSVCKTITEILLSSSLGVDQLKEICNRVKREVYE